MAAERFSIITLLGALVSTSVCAKSEPFKTDTQPPAPIEVRTPSILFPSPYSAASGSLSLSSSDDWLNAEKTVLNIEAPFASEGRTREVDLWARVRAGFEMPDFDHPRVRLHEAWFMARPSYLRRVLGRAQRYLYHITERLEQRGLPTELALLPIVESAYNPHARSPARAAGLWQFIPSTGKDYGLEQTWWYDGRHDVLAATDAALNYFDNLYRLFEDWPLALASYNWGEGAVQRAVAKNQARGLPTDFSSLSLPAETRDYVPKLMALKRLIQDPERFGLTLEPLPNRPYFVPVQTDRHLDVALAADWAGLTIPEFNALNPAYTRPVIASKRTRHVLLPVEKASVFLEKLAGYDQPTVTWQAYNSRRGERLASIAQRYGIGLRQLHTLNRIPEKVTIARGQILLLPKQRAESARPLPLYSARPNTALPQPMYSSFSKALLPSPTSTANVTLALKQISEPGYAPWRSESPEKLTELHDGLSPNRTEGSLRAAPAEVEVPPLTVEEPNRRIARATAEPAVSSHRIERKRAQLARVSAGRLSTGAAAKKRGGPQNVVGSSRTPAVYVVRPGDTVARIARRFRVEAGVARQWKRRANGLRPHTSPGFYKS